MENYDPETAKSALRAMKNEVQAYSQANFDKIKGDAQKRIRLANLFGSLHQQEKKL